MNPATVMRAYHARQRQESDARIAATVARRSAPHFETEPEHAWHVALSRLNRYERHFEAALYRQRQLRKELSEIVVSVREGDRDWQEALQMLASDRDLIGCERKCGGQGYTRERVERAFRIALQRTLDSLVEEARDFTAYAYTCPLNNHFEDALGETRQDGTHRDDAWRCKGQMEWLEKSSQIALDVRGGREVREAVVA
jgi:hypothetical protein